MGARFQPPGTSAPGAPAAPYIHQPYPKWLYHATHGSCIVRSAEEHDALDGLWQESPAAAKAAAERLQDQISEAAAERAYADRLMSPGAQGEVLALERASDGHVVDVPAPPRRPRPR